MSPDSSLMGAINAEHANLTAAKNARSNSILEWVVQRNSVLFQESLLVWVYVLGLSLGIQKLQPSPNKGGMMYDSIIFLFLLYLVDAAYHKLKIWHIITSNLLRHYINDFGRVLFYQVAFYVMPWFIMHFAISLRMQSMYRKYARLFWNDKVVPLGPSH